MELELKPINIFIGSNGSGKSNFISFFKLVNAIFSQGLQNHVLKEKSDNLLYFGRKNTEKLYGKMIFTRDQQNDNAYWFRLAQTSNGGLFIEEEGSGYNVIKDNDYQNYFRYPNNEESIIKNSNDFRDAHLIKYLSNIQVYHFHDTSTTSWLRKECEVEDNIYLKSDGRNLPAFLYLLKKESPKRFTRFVKTIQSVAPYIDSFILEPSRLNKKEIELRWIEKGDPESSFSAYQLSDGTLRFIALAAVLLQPNPPEVIIIDEPELGLHPKAIEKLAGMIKAASEKTQIILSTQSVNLVDCFNPEQIITVDRNEKENQSVFKRLKTEDLGIWLDDYTMGELWEQNIINSAQPFSK